MHCTSKRVKQGLLAFGLVWLCTVLWFLRRVLNAPPALHAPSLSEAAISEIPKWSSIEYTTKSLQYRAYFSPENERTLRASKLLRAKNSNPMSNPCIICLAFNRPHYLDSTLRSLLSLPGIEHYPVYISQDGYFDEVAAVAKAFAARYTNVYHFHHERVPAFKGQEASAYLTQHYRYALDKVFMEYNHTHAIVIEDDMVFSPDFLGFFEQTAPLLERDPTIWCISSWNDNGFPHLVRLVERVLVLRRRAHSQQVSNARRLFRNSYFPGLGWLLRRQLWEELRERWPLDHWDHWMRFSDEKERECISPEMSRNYNIGERGANMMQRDYQKYLRNIVYQREADEVEFGDLTYLESERYAASVHGLVGVAEPVVAPEVDDESGWAVLRARLRANVAGKQDLDAIILIAYRREQFPQLAALFAIWSPPRAHHRHTHLLHLAASNTTYILADQRLSPYLPPPLQRLPNPSLVATPAKPGLSCEDACRYIDMQCDPSQFDYINRCAVLREHFACETGCGTELGDDVPCYVYEELSRNRGKCLLSESDMTCTGSHPHAARLCPCISLRTADGKR